MNCTKSTARKISTKLSDQSTTPPFSAIVYSPFRMTEYSSATMTKTTRPLKTADARMTTVPSFSVDGGGKEFVFDMPPSYLVKRYFLQKPLERRRSEKVKKVGFFASRYRKLCSQKSSFFKLLAEELPAAETSRKLIFWRLTPGGRRQNASDFDVFYDLMYTLAAQIELVGDLAERTSGRTHLKNFGISRRIRRRPWLQRSPLPTRNCLDCRCAFVRKLAFSTTLTYVTDPSAKSYFFSVNSFDVNCWNITMSLSRGELLQGFNVCVETCSVVHGHQIIPTPHMYVDGLKTVLHPQTISYLRRKK